nr:polyprotein 2 [Patatavirales sp.]
MLSKYGFAPLEYKPIFDVNKIPLDQKYFNFICEYPKFPLMKNKKRLDPIIEEIQMAQDFTLKTEFGLPKPNLKASYLSLNKYGKAQPIVDEKAALFAYRCMSKHFGLYMGEAKVLGKEEAIAAMDKTTSPGFPWNMYGSTKNEIFEQMSEQFHEYVDIVWDKYLLEDDYWFVWVNSLKEEIRPIEKIRMNKIRTFTASPMEAVVTGYRLFGDMNDKFYRSNLQSASVVGLCPFYGGWDSLYCKLKNHPKTKKPIAYELDESEYDSSLFQIVFDAIVRFRWNCLSEEDKTPENYKRISNYYRNIVNSVIITADGKIVQKTTGNPSGSVNTIVDNTLALYWLLAYAWYILAEEDLRTYEEFENSVVKALQGDDNTWTVDEETDKFYNARTVSAVFSSVGVTTTSPDYGPRQLEEVEFLSSSFSKFYGGMCIYNLCPEKLVESLKWTKHPGDATMTLIRVLAILRVTWPDKEMRDICKSLARYIIEKYDPIMNDINWNNAKAQFLTDEEFLMFYCGGISNSPIKRDMGSKLINYEILDEVREQKITLQSHRRKQLSQEEIDNLRCEVNNALRRQNVRLEGKRKKRKYKKKQTRKKKQMKKKMPRKQRGGRRKSVANVSSRNRMMNVGIATSGTNGPAFAVSRSSKGKDALFVRGHERVAVVAVGSGGVGEGAVLLNQLVSPELIGKRLPLFARLYDRYCFTAMRFKYVPQISVANAAANGGILLAIEYDPDDPTPAASTDGMNEAFSWEYSEINAVFSSNLLDAKNIAPKKDYYIDSNTPSDERFSKQARFYVFANGPLAEGNYGYIIFEYAVHLYVPQIGQGNVEQAVVGGIFDYSIGGPQSVADGTYNFLSFSDGTPSPGSRGLSDITGSGLTSLETITSPDYSGTYLVIFTLEVLSAGAGTITLSNPQMNAYAVTPLAPLIGTEWWNTDEEIAHNSGPKTTTTNFIAEVNGPSAAIQFNIWTITPKFDVAVASGTWSISVRTAIVALPDNVAPLAAKNVNNTMVGLARRLEELQAKINAIIPNSHTEKNRKTKTEKPKIQKENSVNGTDSLPKGFVKLPKLSSRKAIPLQVPSDEE